VFNEGLAEEHGSTGFSASSSERRGQIRVDRFAFVESPERAFTYAPELSSATVSPPPPFQGMATFQRNPDGSTSWKGDLRVSLPGAPYLALTGPAFDATLSRPVGHRSTFCATFFRRAELDLAYLRHLLVE